MISLAKYKAEHKQKLYSYIAGVLSGGIVANRWIIAACKHSKKWLGKRSKYYLNEKELDRFLTFLYYTNIMIAGEYRQAYLEPWQMWVVGIGKFLYRKVDDLPKHREVTLFVSRKNAKTTLMALLALYDLLTNRKAEAYALASNQNQSNICLNISQDIARNSPKLKERFDIRVSKILNPRNEGVLKSLIGNPLRLDGLNPSIAIIDEAGAVDDYVALKKVMTTGMVARPYAQAWTISTANVSLTNGFYEHIQLGKRVVAGKVDLPEQFFAIYALDDYEKEWNDPKAWMKVCPMMGVTISPQKYEEELQMSQLRASEKTHFLIKNLNEFISGTDKFLPDAVYIKAAREKPQFKEGAVSYIGVDLSATRDLAAISLLQVDENNIYHFDRKIYMPNNPEKMIRRDGISLHEWVKEGYIVQFDSDVVDYEFVARDIIEWTQKYLVSTVNIDPWNSAQIKYILAEHGIFYQDARQTTMYMNTPVKLLEVAFHEERVRTGRSPVVRWMYNNVELITDSTGSVKFSKKNKTEAVDVCIADVNAVYGWYKENIDDTALRIA